MAGLAGDVQKQNTLHSKGNRDYITAMFTGIWRDLVYAGRSLAKARAFTVVCVVSLGIGAAIAGLVAVLASLSPARRAAWVQPMVARRSV